MKTLHWLWAFLPGMILPYSRTNAASLECIQGALTPQAVATWRQEAALQLKQQLITDSTLAERLQTCFGAEMPSCLQRMNDYSRRNDLASGSLDVTVRTSAQKQPPAELMLSGTAPFEYRIPEDIEERAAAKGWPSVRYKSRHSGGFDKDTASLLMIYIPGDRVSPPVSYDRWLNFALPADPESEANNPTPQAALPSAEDYAAEAQGGATLPRIFTMVSLDRAVDAQPGQVYFQRFIRKGVGNRSFVPDRNASPKSCISCHPNGLRAISPLGYHVRKNESALDDAAWEAVKTINAAMIEGAGNRPISWRDAPTSSGSSLRKPLLNPAAFGPSVGPMVPLNGRSRSADFIKQCVQRRRVIEVRDIFGRAPGRSNVYRMSSNPQIDPNKIIRFMSCGACHGTAQRSPLNGLTDWAQIDFKILVDQSMPLGVHKNPLETNSGQVQDNLTADERMALANCLQAEFALESKELTGWLTQTECR